VTIHLHLGPVTVSNVAAPRPEDVHIPTIIYRGGKTAEWRLTRREAAE